MGKIDLYNYFTAAGLTHAGALGLLGNLQAESGCESCRLQGDFDLTRFRSKAYAAKVDSGEMSVHVMANDQAGWGLAQWTYPQRKANLANFCKERGVSIADETSQAAFILKELREEYFQLLKFLCSTDEMYTATKRICEEYERPAINNVQARYAMAQSIEKQIAGSTQPVGGKPVGETYWPPRTLDKNMSGGDVLVIQALLSARGLYKGDFNGRFADRLESAVREFQKKKGLSVDGVVGPMTWKKLLERE
jgi:hypothetical protein